MLYSKTCEYAFRALTHVAQRSERLCMAKDIAQEEGIPLHFLAKLLQDLAKMGVLRSFKGPTGGFMLAKPAEAISLYDIMQLVDRSNLEETCAVGLYECSDNMPCPIHDSWKGLRQKMLDYLRTTTIADLSSALTEKKRILARRAKAAPGRAMGGKKKTAR